MLSRVTAALGVVAMFAGCATTGDPQVASLQEARTVAWSVDAKQDEMLVSVSPARQTLQIAGTTGLIVGSGISAVVNDKYRLLVRDALEGYDAGALFEERLAARLAAAMAQDLVRVAPLGTTAGHQTRRDVQRARLDGIAANTDADVLLDLEMTYGIFGYEGFVVAKLDGRVVTVPHGREVWSQTLLATTQPPLASQKLSDPTKQLGPDLGGLRLTVEEGAVAQWTTGGGAELRRRYEEAVDGVIVALLAALDLAHDPVGDYYLGRNAMNRKRFAEADDHFRRALAADPGYVPAMNGRAVNLYHNDQVDAAIEIAKHITENYPDYGPAWYNLAWFYAEGTKDGAGARAAYERARQLGMPDHSKIEKRISTQRG
jgi:tetratricopeptide (TPR) repeat protein